MNGRKTNTPISIVRARKISMGLDNMCYNFMEMLKTDKLCVQKLCNRLLDRKMQTPGLFFTYRTSWNMNHNRVLWLGMTTCDDTDVLTGDTLMSHHWQSILVMICVHLCLQNMHSQDEITCENSYGREKSNHCSWLGESPNCITVFKGFGEPYSTETNTD